MTVRGGKEPPDRKSLSEATFEQVLAAAADLDERASSHISVARAREIALDLGVSPAAWDTALANHERTTPAMGPRPRAAPWHVGRHMLIAVGSSILGLVSGVAERLNNSVETIVGLGGFALLVAVTVGLLLVNLPRSAQARFQVDVVTWWWPFPVAYSIAYGRLFDDVFLIGGLCWFLAAVVGGAAIEYRARATRGGPASGAATA